MHWSILLLVSLLMVGCATVDRKPGSKALSADAKILFIGNSYTAPVHKTISEMAVNAGYKDADIQVVWGGGATLERLINNGRAFKRIDEGGWDVVILQEQSLRPALGGKSEEAFHKSVDELVARIRKVGAEPVLYMTWERRDGWKRDGKVVLDSETMRNALSTAYREAAERNKIRVAPVGEVWAAVREKDADLGMELYANDGSHPSTKGTYLACCVFLRVLFNDPLTEIDVPKGMTEVECSLIKDAVSTALK